MHIGISNVHFLLKTLTNKGKMIHYIYRYMKGKKAMKKVWSFVLAGTMALSSLSATAAEVVWGSDTLSRGTLTANVREIEAGDMVSVALYQGDELTNVSVQTAESDTATVSVRATNNDEYARVFVWDKDSLEPKGEITSRLTKNGVWDDAIFSDNQISNKADSVGYKTIDPLTGEYSIKMNVTVLSKGDNAIMLGDSDNGALSYGSSSAILLFNGDDFAVRAGNGSGGYSASAVNLCPVELNKTYEIEFRGNIETNTYQVIITAGDERFVSTVMTARTNGEAIDTIALISNSKNTTVNDGYYSDFAFLGKNLEISTDPEDIVVEPLYVYDGFEGLYYGIKVDGMYVRGNNGRLSYDYSTVADTSAMFIPRDMGDGSYAFVCRSSNNRITIPGTGWLDGDNLRSAAYATNDNTQHWILEESENYSEDNLSYYIKHIDSDEYMGTTSSWLYGDILALVDESEKTEFTFEPLYDESPLYKVSRMSVYNMLTDRQRYMLESVYESVAGDIFGRYGGHAEWTPRIRMDNMFNDILSGNLTEAEQLQQINDFLNKSVNGHIYDGQASYQTVSTSLPGTDGLYWEVDEGTAGTYDFWRGTKLDGVLYKLTIYEADGTEQQTINLYVQDDGIAQKNAETFKSIIVQIPHNFRRHLRNVKVRSDNANSYNGGGSDMYIRLNWSPDANGMRSTVVHELGHIIDSQNGYWASGAGWANAIAADMYAPSTYGATNATEDFAEFSRMYFSAYGNADMQRGLQVIMPERYASFGRLRKNNMDGWGLWEDEYTK